MEQCILWTKSKNSYGYGVTWYNGKIAYIHRVIAKAKPNEIVMHTCDNRACINPNHLRIGTSQDNSSDMVSKNRQAKGEACGNSKLTEEQVKEIRSYHTKLSSRKVAKLFNISKTNVLDIWKNNIWKHL